MRAEFTALKTKLDRLNTAFADGGLDLAEFKEMKNPLVPKKTELEEQLVSLERSKLNRLEPVRNWVFEATQAEKSVFNENWPELKSLLKKVGSNRQSRAQTLTAACTKPLNSLAETVVAIRDSSGVSVTNSKWWSLLNDARTFFDENPVV